ncbi:isocitrate lyase/phosphoenolpyruvate mutase family protein [Luteimonas sp. R10]|uniref:isocitrate lyase/PEP mutase family protein n=1 Tax=Luteimonas sp. R10 TaxID=3108176 RepID=UPI003085B4BC|nr:isocitrate lyase/phosphoenolpyruvate mutase family protein [Luteimonas sp. R10]
MSCGGKAPKIAVGQPLRRDHAMTQPDLARAFHALHVAGRPLVLFNAWDAGSARAIAAGGAKAIATGSWSVAAANGFGDGEQLPLDLALGNLARIVAAVELPVSIDLESGYGANPDEVGGTVARAIDAGAVGCNLEDSFPHDGSLRAIEESAQRIAAARRAADERGVAFFINARTDVYFQKDAAKDEAANIEMTIERAQAYAKAGASGLFVPGLAAPDSIRRVVEASLLPVNIMVMGDTPSLAELAALGVARVSHGPGPYSRAMAQLTEAARAALETDQA